MKEQTEHDLLLAAHVYVEATVTPCDSLQERQAAIAIGKAMLREAAIKFAFEHGVAR